MWIKGSLFVHLPKSYQQPSVEKRLWQGHQADFVQTQGQAQDRTRATRGYFKDNKRLKRTYEDKPMSDLGQHEHKKRTSEGQPPRESDTLIYNLLFHSMPSVWPTLDQPPQPTNTSVQDQFTSYSSY